MSDDQPYAVTASRDTAPAEVVAERFTDTDLESCISVGTLVRFLFGSRRAILTLASQPNTFWLGLVFVLSAGFAREYDRTYLPGNLWVIVLPMLAVAGSSLVLFGLVEIVARVRGSRCGRFWYRYKTFVAIHWMTAPLAWIFIIPVERFLSPDDATMSNLWFLCVVTTWRVVLLTRVLSVLYVPNANEVLFTGMFFVVMLVVDTMALTLVGPASPPMLVGTLGGTRQTAADHILLSLKFGASILQILSWPVWMVGTLAVAFWNGSNWSWTVPMESPVRPLTKPMKVLAATSLLVWTIVLPLTQPDVWRRNATDRELNGVSEPSVELEAAQTQSPA